MKRLNKHFTKLAKAYLADLEKIEQSFIKKEFNNKRMLRFWGGLVRDSNGKWLKYYFEGYKYFQYGIQLKPDLTNKNDIYLINASIKQIRAFIQGLINQDFKDYKTWLKTLHRKQIYNKNEIGTITRRRFALIIHSRIVLNAVIPLTVKYHDPYTNKGVQIIYLPKVDKEGLPKDIWENEKEVFHYYPDPKFLNQYLEVMQEKLQDIITSNSEISDHKLLSSIASYYQYGINTHMFENINQSLFANQMNALLQVFGYNPINHGILDFVAMRLQPVNFVKYFINEVKAGQKQKKLSLQLSNIQENRYLKLSKLI